MEQVRIIGKVYGKRRFSRFRNKRSQQAVLTGAEVKTLNLSVGGTRMVRRKCM